MVNVTLDRQNLMTFAQDNEMSVQEKKNPSQDLPHPENLPLYHHGQITDYSSVKMKHNLSLIAIKI